MTDKSILFEPFTIKGLTLKNRLTMAPLFLGYANPDGKVSPLILEHYQEMAASGLSLVVVENVAVDVSGLGSPFTLRLDDDVFLEGLAELAQTIHEEGALAFLQLNHAGRYAYTPERLAPSPFQTGGVTPKEMTAEDIDRICQAYVSAAGRVRQAGYDGVEIHGGTGYLPVQFLSARTNHRTDQYGGSLENRMRFPLRLVDSVIREVGPDYPVGYRFLADECLPGGLGPEETTVFAKKLVELDPAYLSVMAGTYDSFVLPEYRQKEKSEGYMVSYAADIKKACPGTPVITAGRIQSFATAREIIENGRADLVGLARVILADPLWPQKARGLVPGEVVACEPNCMLCMKRVMSGKPAYCSQWTKERRQEFLAKIGERPEQAGDES